MARGSYGAAVLPGPRTPPYGARGRRPRRMVSASTRTARAHPARSSGPTPRRSAAARASRDALRQPDRRKLRARSASAGTTGRACTCRSEPHHGLAGRSAFAGVTFGTRTAHPDVSTRCLYPSGGGVTARRGVRAPWRRARPCGGRTSSAHAPPAAYADGIRARRSSSCGSGRRLQEDGQRSPGRGVPARGRREGRPHVDQRLRAAGAGPVRPVPVVGLLVRGPTGQADVGGLRVAHAARVGGTCAELDAF